MEGSILDAQSQARIMQESPWPDDLLLPHTTTSGARLAAMRKLREEAGRWPRRHHRRLGEKGCRSPCQDLTCEVSHSSRRGTSVDHSGILQAGALPQPHVRLRDYVRPRQGRYANAYRVPEALLRSLPCDPQACVHDSAELNLIERCTLGKYEIRV